MTAERIRALEVQQEQAADSAEQIARRLDAIESELQGINSKLDKQKGFIAGAMFILVPVWGAIVTGAAWLWDKIVEGSLP